MTSIISDPMAWTNERLKLSCTEGIGLKALWKMIILDNNHSSSKKQQQQQQQQQNNFVNSTENIAELLSNHHRELTGNNKTNSSTSAANNNMSLLKFLAINALELSAPASPLLLQQNNNTIPSGWLQLAGHPASIAPSENGIVRKRISGPSDSEAIAYRGLCKDMNAVRLTPHFYGIQEHNGETFLELQDLLNGFNNPAVMDIKMGCRTFLESEVTNDSLRPDLYKKMCAVNSQAPTEEEHRCEAITKLRYMLFRENISSSETKGFRVEALKMRGAKPVTDLKTMKCGTEVGATIAHFLDGRSSITLQLIKRIKEMRKLIECSDFFQTHEIVGSSVFIVYDDQRVGAWLIDFAKTRKLPDGIKIDHRSRWVQGNCEEGLLHGIDELIKVLEKTYDQQLDQAASTTATTTTSTASTTTNIVKDVKSLR